MRFRRLFSTSRRCSWNRSPSRLPVSPVYNFLQRLLGMQKMTLAEAETGEMISDVDASLGSRYFLNVAN